MKVLLTGFMPFGKSTINPSYEAVKLVPDEILGAEIVKREIPVVFRKGGEAVIEAIREVKPDVVVLVGQAGGRFAITPERIAINVEDCSPSFPDNEGNAPQGEAIAADGPDAYFTTLPIKAMVKKMMDNGIPASISNTAGTYVCNDIMYHMLHLLHNEFPTVRGGFIHVPYATIQLNAKYPSMSIDDMARGLTFSIEAILENEKDIDAAGGSTH